MMSAQPLLPSNTDIFTDSKWHELIKLTEQLLLQSNLESQITYVIRIVERNFSCTTRIWLADSFRNMIMDEVFLLSDIYMSNKTELMMKAYEARQITSQQGLNSPDNKLPSIIAIPLMIRDEVLGVIQLERIFQVGFTNQDTEFIRGLCLQVAVALETKRQATIYTSQQKKYEMLISAAQISKSITSNLDLKNLLNSVVTLIHQSFGFSKVNIITIQGEKKITLTKVGISLLGLELAHEFFYNNDNSPVSWVVSHREPIVINDTSLENRFIPSSFDAYTKSELIIPLISGDLLIGVLDLCSDVVNSFIYDEFQIFQSLSENITLAIRNARLYRSEQLVRQVAERLRDVIGRISADTSYDEILNKILNELEKALPCDASVFWLYDNVTSVTGIEQFTSSLKLVSVNVKERSISSHDQIQTPDINEIKDRLLLYEDESTYLLTEYPWLSEIENSKHPLIRNSAVDFEPIGHIFSLPDDYSAIGIPLFINDQPLGIIISMHHLPHQYTDESIIVASAFANYVSVAIENARLFTTAHDQIWMSTVLQQVTEGIQSTTSLTDLVETINNMLIDLVGANGCTLFMWDQSLDAFFPQSSYGFDEEQQARLNSWVIYSGTVIGFEQLVQSRSPVILNSDTLSDDIMSLIFPTHDFQSNLLIIFPMIAQDSLIGAILIDFKNTTLGKNSFQKFWDDMYTLIQGISHQAAVAIENLQTIKSREEEAYISVALLQVAQAIVSLNQLDEILGSIVRITPILVGVKRCIIYLWDNLEMVFHPAQYFGFSKNDIQIENQIIKPNEFPLLKTVFDRNQVTYHQLEPTSPPSSWKDIKQSALHIIEGIALDSDEEFRIELDDQALRDKLRLLIGFPLSIKGEVLGVMLIEEEDQNKGSTSYHIREKRIEIVKGITQQAALAIKNELLQQEAVNSERMERELQLAREIQKTFLPDHLPILPGWDLDIRWQPARQVAGDFYDILLLDGNRLGFVIADVADKGMPAALFMTLIRTLIRAAAKEYSSPAEVLKQVNDLLVPDAKNGMFVTVFYAVIYLESGMIKYANAGHNPPIIRRLHSDELVELTRTSVALGIFDDAEVEEGEVSLRAGDWILFYTDGVTEAFSVNEEMFGTKRLFDLLLGNKYTSSKEILDMIEGSVHEFVKGIELSDDITIGAIFNKLN
jgi:sigma-B regulation protein RsbU (phosphoserine phosphatase)